MNNKLLARWEKEHKNIPEDKSPSPYVEKVEKEFSRNSLVADIGGGTGADSIYLLQRGHNVIEVDISPSALALSKKKAQKLGLKLDTRRVTLGEEPVPIEDNSLDVIYSRLALHYFNRETTIAVFKELFGKLKKGGHAFITIKSTEDKAEMDYLYKNAVKLEDGMFDDRGVLKSRFTAGELRGILIDAGIPNATVNPYTEDLTGRRDWVKSKNMALLLNEIRFTKP